MTKNHLKSIASPKAWPILRKKNVFVTKANPGPHNQELSVPISFFIRDILKLVEKVKEVKYLLHEKTVLVNGKKRKDHRFPIGRFDIVEFKETKEKYQLLLNKKGKLMANKVTKSVKPIKVRDQLKERFDTLRIKCGNHICGPGFILHHYDTPIEGALDVEAGFPVSEPIETGEITTRLLPGMYALTTIFKGPYDQMREEAWKLHRYRSSRGLAAELSPREVYLTGPFMDNPEENVTEIQSTIHDWDIRFCKGLDLFDDETKSEILEGFDKLTPHSSAEDRAAWVIKSLEKIDQIANEDQKCELVSRCAHVRPPADIKHWKSSHSLPGKLEK